MRIPTFLLVVIWAMVGAGSAHAQSKCQSLKLAHALKKAACLGVLEAKRIKTSKPLRRRVQRRRRLLLEQLRSIRLELLFEQLHFGSMTCQ